MKIPSDEETRTLWDAARASKGEQEYKKKSLDLEAQLAAKDKEIAELKGIIDKATQIVRELKAMI